MPMPSHSSARKHPAKTRFLKRIGHSVGKASANQSHGNSTVRKNRADTKCLQLLMIKAPILVSLHEAQKYLHGIGFPSASDAKMFQSNTSLKKTRMQCLLKS